MTGRQHRPDSAQRAIEGQAILRLSAEDQRRFAEALIQPPAPNATLKDVKRKYAACYVLIERSTGKVAGFYTLSAHSIPLNDIAPELAKKLPRYPTPNRSRLSRDLPLSVTL